MKLQLNPYLLLLLLLVYYYRYLVLCKCKQLSLCASFINSLSDPIPSFFRVLLFPQSIMSNISIRQPQRNWAETCFGCSCLQQLFWTRMAMRKWLNITHRRPEDEPDPDDFESDEEAEFDGCGWERESRLIQHRENGPPSDSNDTLPMLRRRRKSETFRAQYINTKELRVCVGTWNVGGKAPPDDLDIDDWLHVDEPADIYVVGLQEIVPLNAGNIFGPEDSRAVTKWENIIRDTLNRIRPVPNKIKSFSDPPSPSKFKPPDDIQDIDEEILLESDSDIGEEVHPVDDESNFFGELKEACDTDGMFIKSRDPDWVDSSQSVMPAQKHFQRQFSSSKRLDRLNCLRTDDSNESIDTTATQQNSKMTRLLSGTERIGLSWPEPPMHLLPTHALERANSFRSFKASKSFKTYNSFKSSTNDMTPDLALLAEIDLEALMKRKRKSSFVRIVSKKMVGLFISVWVRRSLRRHIQNVKVSTVGVGVMGYIGNKGSISVSMSIYQTLFCFICTHLTSGEKDGDENKRNADVYEIRRRTHFNSSSSIELPKRIQDHEKIIWLGDLNYRLNLPYEKVRKLISRKQWSKLLEKDQLVRELRKGRAFDGWSEGTLNFPPTYKYEINSEKYYGEDPKIGRRIPAWCDRILSYGKGMRLLSYRRAELKLSDHRPVTAIYVAEVEVFSPRRLQRALTFTDAEVDNEEAAADRLGIDYGMSCYTVEEEGVPNWER